MKRLYIFLLALFCLTSCNDYLDIKPKNLISLETENDIKSLMSSYMYGITHNNSSGTKQAIKVDNQYVFFPYNSYVTTNFMFYSDNIIHEEIPNAYYAWNFYLREYYQAIDWKGYDFAKSIWEETYQNIGFYNIIIDACVDLENKESIVYKEVLCEARLLRAMMFFDMLKYFSPYKNNEMGIPVNTKSKFTTSAGRQTQKEVYKFLIEELNSILALSFKATSWNQFYSKDRVYALLSQIYWFKAESAAKDNNDWNLAANYAEKVLEGRSLANTSEELKSVFSSKGNGFNKNNPYALFILTNGRLVTSTYFAPWGSSSRYGIPADNSLIALYDDNDIRLKSFFDSNLKVDKWKLDYKTVNIVPLWRIAEFKLIAAESYARIGDKARALSHLNDFKKSRIAGFTSYAENDLIDEIIRERRKEFCYEFGMRWTDLKRLGKGFSRIGISEKADKGNNKITFTLEDNDYRFALPIPVDSELKENEKLEQNPGWII